MTDIDTIADRLNAIGNPTRLRIFRFLVRAGDNGVPVGRIQEELGIPGSTLSHHLKLLDSVDLVRRERKGTSLIYRAQFDGMRALVGSLVDECCADMPANSNVAQARRQSD